MYFCKPNGTRFPKLQLLQLLTSATCKSCVWPHSSTGSSRLEAVGWPVPSYMETKSLFPKPRSDDRGSTCLSKLPKALQVQQNKGGPAASPPSLCPQDLPTRRHPHGLRRTALSALLLPAGCSPRSSLLLHSASHSGHHGCHPLLEAFLCPSPQPLGSP